MNAYLWIALGSALGGMARHGCTVWMAARTGSAFPWGTVTVNIVGSLLIGAVAALGEPQGRFGVGPATQQFLMVGVLGGYTTFSSFSLQTLALMRSGEWGAAGLNVFLSVALCLLGVWLGHCAGTALSQVRA